MSGSAKVPGNWHIYFLANADNKKELFLFLPTKIAQIESPDDKEVHITSSDQVVSVGRNGSNMGPAITRKQSPCPSASAPHSPISLAWVVHTATDVVIIFSSNFHHLIAVNPAAEI